MDPLLLFKDAGNMATFAADFFRPIFSQWQGLFGEMAVTLQIAVWDRPGRHPSHSVWPG